jgi:hypothetical protein
MKMFFYRGRRPNFGDQLNAWMWPRLLPDFFDDDDRTLFLGIGSTLYDFFPKASRKVVFGAGYGGYTPVPTIDDRWNFYFVRGRLTADKLGLASSLAVGDAAILVRSCGVVRPQKTHRVSFMPHWESAIDGNWAQAARTAGLHYIDPCAEVEQVLDDILRSDLVVTEAMHGAIVSDALRVPWVPARPLQTAHRWKWQDWASVLDIDLRFGRVPASNALEYALSLVGPNKRNVQWVRTRGQRLRRLGQGVLRDRAARSLARLAAAPAHLSSDAAIDRAHSRMREELTRLQRDFS